MALSLNRAAVLTWVFLVCASIATGALIEGKSLGPAAAVSLIFLIAVFKARMIVLHYMELKHAPLQWRLAFELWVVVAAALILGIWLFTGAAGECPVS